MTGKRALYRRKPCTITPCSVLYLVGIYNKTVDDSEGIIEYTSIPIYDFSDGYDYQEKAFLNALSDLNLVLLHPGRDMFNY